MDLSVRILEDMHIHQQSPLNEQELSILNEGFGDFFKSIKDMAIDKMQKVVLAKYQQIELVQKSQSSILKRGGINADKIATIVNNVVIGYKSKLESSSKRKDGKALQNTVNEIGNKVKEDLEKKKGSWFGIKYWDPAEYFPPLFITIVVITLKAIILGLMVWFPLTAAPTLAVSLYHILVVFVVMPMLEEAGKLFAIKSGAGGKFLVIFNIVDFGLMFATKIAMGSSLLAFILMRLVAVALHSVTHYIQKVGHATETSEESFRIAWFINACRNFAEIMLMYSTRVAEVAAKVAK